MKHITLLILLLILSLPLSLSAQLPDGATAPDWTHDDIFGNTYNLYDLLDEGKMVVLKFSATWCGPCWNYMQTGALEDFWNEHGPNGTDEAQVFYIESDQNTGIDDLYGLTSGTQGNWVANMDFPIIDLQWGENTDNDYDINYYPTLYAVCSDKKIYELGQVPASEWAEFIQSCALTAEVANVEDATCFGDGEITLNVVEGVNPIEYDWSDGSTGPSLQNLGAGVYSVTVTEGNGRNVIIEDIVITGAETPIELAASEIEPALCFETSTGNISVELGAGVEPYSYVWSNGAQTQNISNLSAGFYTLNATDDNGCPFEETFEVTEPDELEAAYETTPEYCDQGNGTVVLEIEGGVGNYEVYSSDGVVNENIISELYAGTVTATVEDGNGCVWEENIDIEFTAEHEIFFSPDPTITCLQPTTEVTGFIIGGFDDYEYVWSTTNGNIIGATNMPTILVDQAGDYDLIVYDLFSGCVVQNAVAVTSTMDPPAVSAGTDTPISCENLELDLSGTGAPTNAISWSTPDGNIVSGGDTYTPTVDAPGSYIIEVVNPTNSCINRDTVIVINQIQPADADYQYQTSGLTMAATDASSGSGLSGWAWTFGDGNTSSEQNPTYTYANEGTYDVCLTVLNGCDTSTICQSISVTSTGGSISVISEIQHVFCHADSTGSINLIVNGGSGSYSFSWSGPNGEMFSTDSIYGLYAGNYNLVISDDQGNNFFADYTVNQPTPIELVGSTVVDNICFGHAEGSLAVDITGGVGSFSYSFNGGPAQAENSVSNLSAGTIDCQITDANGCPFQAGPYTIQEPPAITNQSVITNVKCYEETNGAVSLTIGGGVAPYVYLWDINGVQDTLPQVSMLAAGQYVCAVTDHNGCIENVVVNIGQPDLLTASSITILDATNEQQTNGSITIEISGGTAPFIVTWSNGATGTTINDLAPGEYTYTIVDANGCKDDTSAPVIVNGTVSTTYAEWGKYITIAPNPSKGDVIVSWKGLTVDKGTMTLLTMDGRKLNSASISSGTGEWDLSGMGLSNGVYIVMFEINKQAIPFRLVVL